MYYLVYSSVPSFAFAEVDFKNLLVQCNQNNSALGVTGLLFYCNKKIVQLLEGDKPVVLALFERIKQDTRHRNVVKLLEGTLKKRNFDRWSMGFKALDPDSFRKLSGYEDIDALFENSQITDDSHPALIFLTLLYKKNYYDHKGMIA
jgi:hypothetical protein